MRRRLAAALACLLVPAALTVVGASAQADPPPTADPYSGHWPMCGEGADDDGKYCVVTVTRNGAPVAPRAGDEEYEEPYVDLIGDGTVRFGVAHFASGSFVADGDADPSATWRWQVNTGSIRTREMYGRAKNVALALGGNATTGYTFTLRLQPVGISEVFYDSSFVCDPYATCGDDTTVADLEYTGFATGYVTDNEGGTFYTAEQLERRTGLVTAYSAQQAAYTYNYETNAIDVRLANPHLMMDGVTPVTGSFETFIPYDVLLTDMGVPDPGSLTGGQMQVTRAGAASVPFTLTQEADGVRIRILGITFSTPRYTIRPKPSRPGVPTLKKVTRKANGKVKVKFTVPVADGGSRIKAYDARCRKGKGAWHTSRKPGSPIVVTGVPQGKATCQVRARNKIGASTWSAKRSS